MPSVNFVNGRELQRHVTADIPYTHAYAVPHINWPPFTQLNI